ncbi:hypothetical protein HU200_039672 [Digitaria exilis]|uniref:Uncharacterized protein n=1 Tax=Digitaria exilis TaxID=1010633 RepID=A0A835EFB3_9POAL|nr:hypothetical protein HU200_039672 [Digitaria exilis]
MSSRFWRWYADRQFHKWEKTVVWDMVEPYRPPRSFAPLVGTYVAAFYTGVIGAAVTEQLYKVSRPHHFGFSIPPPPRWPLPAWRFSTGAAARARQVLVGMLARETAPCQRDFRLLFNSLFFPDSQEKYWEDHPGEAVPIMPPKFYWGPWRVMNGEVPRFIQSPEEPKTA